MAIPDPFKVWERLPVRYHFATYATVAFMASIAAGALDFRWATPAWVVTGLGGAFLCIYAFPSVWRYLVYIAFIYVAVGFGAIMPLFYLKYAPLFIGASAVAHILGVLVAYNLVKDVNLSRRAYHEAAATEGKWAPYVPMGLWTLSLAAFMVLVDVSMWGFSSWAQYGGSLAPYLACEVLLVLLVMYLLEVPERAFGGKGADFVPRVSLSEVGAETRKVVKKIVTRVPRDATEATRRAVKRARRPAPTPKTLATGTHNCPACGSELKLDVRLCPECYKSNDFAWCPVSEHYIIPCPSCGKPTVYGEDKCRHCGFGLAADYICPSCRKAAPLDRWGRA